MVDSQDKVLIVGPAWVGDMVIAHSLIQIVAEGDRPARVSVLAPTLMAPLLARMPEVAETIVTPFIHGRLQLSARWRLARTIRQMGFGRAIILPGSLKAALVPFLAGIPQRIGFLGGRLQMPSPRRCIPRLLWTSWCVVYSTVCRNTV